MKVDNTVKDKNGNSIFLPKSINILSTEYSVEYYDNPVECSGNHAAVDGTIDYFDRIIRVHKMESFQHAEIMKVLLHEIIHGIVQDLKITTLQDHKDEESIIDQLSVGIIDTMIRNNMIHIDYDTRPQKSAKVV